MDLKKKNVSFTVSNPVSYSNSSRVPGFTSKINLLVFVLFFASTPVNSYSALRNLNFSILSSGLFDCFIVLGGENPTVVTESFAEEEGVLLVFGEAVLGVLP